VVVEQAPPNDAEAEATVLASLMVDAEAISRVAAFLQPEDFFQERHGLIYDAALALWDRSEAINQVTVAHELVRRTVLEDAGGLAYISHIVAELPTAIGVEYSAKIVQRDAVYRRLIEAAGQMARIGYAGGPNLQEGLGRSEALLMALRGGERLRDFVVLRDLLESFLGPPDESDPRLAEPARTGFAELDKLLTGLKRSDLVILAARPSVGKSALALSMSQNLALGQGGKVALFSLEMSAEQLASRLVSAEAEVEFQRLPWGKHSEVEEGRISRAIGRLSRAEIYIDDTPGITIAELRAKSRRLANDVGLDLIVVDHIQLTHAGSSTGADGNRVAEMSHISRSLKELARELDVPVLALSQLSRAVEQRHPHVPMLSDLRESGSIEQDADVVMFIYREDMYVAPDEWDDMHPEEPEAYPNGDAQIIVAKHRNGPTGTVHLRFVKRLAKFEDFFLRDDSDSSDLDLAEQAGLTVGAGVGDGGAATGGSGSGMAGPGTGPNGSPDDAQWSLDAYDD